MFHGAASAGGGNVRPDRPPNSAKTVVNYIHLFHVSTTSFWTYMSAAWAQLEFNFGQQEFVLGIVGKCSPCWACVGPNLCGRCPHTGPGCVMLDTTCAHTAKFDPSRLRLGQVGPCSPRIPCYTILLNFEKSSPDLRNFPSCFQLVTFHTIGVRAVLVVERLEYGMFTSA